MRSRSNSYLPRYERQIKRQGFASANSSLISFILLPSMTLARTISSLKILRIMSDQSSKSDNLTHIAEISIAYSHKADPQSYPLIRTSRDAYDVFMKVWDKSTIDLYETMWMLLLSRSNNVLGAFRLSQGGVAATIVDAKIVFGTALKAGASSIILAHNHPSGNLRPSQPDKEITKNLQSGGEILGISLLDHLIISSQGYASFADDSLFLPY